MSLPMRTIDETWVYQEWLIGMIIYSIYAMKETILLYIFKLPFYKEILNDYAYIYLTFFFF